MAGTGIIQFENYCLANLGSGATPMDKAFFNTALEAIKEFKASAPKNRERRKSIRHVNITPHIRTEIWRMHRETKLSQRDIAQRLGLNQGRVNEVLQLS